MKRLRDLQVEEVSLVDRPAVRDPENPTQPARFLLWKSETGGDRKMAVDEKLLEALEQPSELEAKLEEALTKAQVSKDEAEAAKMALRILGKYKDKFANVLRALAEVAGYGYPSPSQKAETEQKPPEINKAELPPQVREALEKAERERKEMEERLRKAEEIAKAEREARLNREYVEKATREYANIAKAEELGPVLRVIDEKLEKAEAEKLHQWLRAANERIEKGALFAELGRSGAAPSSVIAKVEARADEIRKADSKLTKEQAVAKALEEHPEWYAEYVRELEVK